MKRIVSFIATAVLLGAMFRIMLFFVDLNLRSDQVYGTDSWMRLYPSFAGSVSVGRGAVASSPSIAASGDSSPITCNRSDTVTIAVR